MSGPDLLMSLNSVHRFSNKTQYSQSTKEQRQGRLARWVIVLQRYDFRVHYVPGPRIAAAEALSRHPPPSVSSIQVTATTDWQKGQAQDEF
jgi:hypothetical protein